MITERGRAWVQGVGERRSRFRDLDRRREHSKSARAIEAVALLVILRFNPSALANRA
jgi:hypothetical protein